MRRRKLVEEAVSCEEGIFQPQRAAAITGCMVPFLDLPGYSGTFIWEAFISSWDLEEEREAALGAKSDQGFS